MQKTLVAVPGVRIAEISLESSLATVRFDPNTTGPDALTAAVKVSGFGAERREAQ